MVMHTIMSFFFSSKKVALFVCLVAQLYPILCNPTYCSPPGSSVHGDSPGKSTGVGCHALLQGIFPTQVLNPNPPHCRRILYHLNHQGSPKQSFIYLNNNSLIWAAKNCLYFKFSSMYFLEKAIDFLTNLSDKPILQITLNFRVSHPNKAKFSYSSSI